MVTENDIDRFIAEEFDESNWGDTSWSKESIIDRLRLKSAEETIRGVTLNTYIIDIFKDATNLRNALGDMEGYAAEVAHNIRNNVLVLASVLKKKPSRLIIDAIRGLPREEAIKIAEKTISELNDFVTVLMEDSGD